MNELQELVKDYVNNKLELERLQNLVESQNKSIKEQLNELNINEIEVDNIKASVTTSTRVTMNEKKLLFIVENTNDIDNKKELIKTRKYVDMNVLENMIYHNEIPNNVLKMIGECKDEKEIKSLRISKAKR